LRTLPKNGAKPKAAPAPVVPKEPPAPPLFDQWLAVLKFLTGWNDQRSYTTEDIEGALMEHLTEEGILNSGTTKQLCATIVPLLSDLRGTDKVVMKNVKKDVLKTLKIIQIFILRIVTFELIRERDAKAIAAKAPPPPVVKKVKGKKKEPKEGAPYLAADISTIAKTLQHFRFEGVFTLGLQKLIVTIRESKPKAPKEPVVKGDTADSKSAVAAKKTTEPTVEETSATKRKATDLKKSAESEPVETPATKRKVGDASDGDTAALARKAGSSEDATAAAAKKSTADSDKSENADSAAKKSTADKSDKPDSSDKVEVVEIPAAAERTPIKRQRQMV